jgi:hypothetical protein
MSCGHHIPLFSWRVKAKADWETERNGHRACAPGSRGLKEEQERHGSVESNTDSDLITHRPYSYRDWSPWCTNLPAHWDIAEECQPHFCRMDVYRLLALDIPIYRWCGGHHRGKKLQIGVQFDLKIVDFVKSYGNAPIR